MKTTRLFSLVGTALVGLSVPAWAGPHGAGGGLAGGGHFAGSHFGGSSGGIHAAPTFSGGGVHFSGNQRIGGLSRASVQQFSYYSGAHICSAATHLCPTTAGAINKSKHRQDSSGK